LTLVVWKMCKSRK